MRGAGALNAKHTEISATSGETVPPDARGGLGVALDEELRPVGKPVLGRQDPQTPYDPRSLNSIWAVLNRAVTQEPGQALWNHPPWTHPFCPP